MALLPTEIEIEDIDVDVFRAVLDQHEWAMQADSVQPKEIDEELKEIAAQTLPSSEFRTFSQTRTYLPTQMVSIGICWVDTV